MIGPDLSIWEAYLDLTHRYADEVDARNGAAVAALFTAGGTWDGTAFRIAPVNGHRDLERHFCGGPEGVRSVHLVLNHRILEVSEFDARATSLAHVIQHDGSQVSQLIVRYLDRLERRDAWLFSERVLQREMRF